MYLVLDRLGDLFLKDEIIVSNKYEQEANVLYVQQSGNFGGAPKSLSYILNNINRSMKKVKLNNISKVSISHFFIEILIDFLIVNGIKPFCGSIVAPNTFKLFLKNIERLSCNKQLKNDYEQLYQFGNALKKNQVLTLLSTLKLFF